MLPLKQKVTSAPSKKQNIVLKIFKMKLILPRIVKDGVGKKKKKKKG